MPDAANQYDSVILRHYRDEAVAHGLSETSTMADARTRELETSFLLTAIRELAGENKVSICDAGCGNGYTVAQLRANFPAAQLFGLEFTPELRELAKARFVDHAVEIGACDIRQRLPLAEPVDIVISQRVLINLLDLGDQKAAVQNLIDAVKVGGHLLVIEAFSENLRLLNEARAEFELEPIGEAHHNLYFEEDFFEQFDRLARVQVRGTSEHFLSTHYFVTRVIHAATFAGKPFVRNSHFVRFFSEALAPAGAYAPLRGMIFQRKR